MEIVYPNQGLNKTLIAENLILSPGVTYKFQYGRRIGSTAKVLYYFDYLAVGDSIQLTNNLISDGYFVLADSATVTGFSGTYHKVLNVSKEYNDIVEITVTAAAANSIRLKIVLVEWDW